MFFLSQMKRRVEFIVFRTVEFVFASLPLEMASNFSGAGWRWIAPLTRRHARAIANIKRAFPEKPDAECDAMARAMWENLGRTFGEFFHLREIYDSGRIDASALNANLDIFAGRKPAIVCAAHQGNWEIASMGPVRLGARPVGIYQRLSNPLVDQHILRKRAPFYPGGLLEKNHAAGAIALRQLRAGGSLAILADLRDGAGVEAPFFGRPAPSTPFPARLALMLDIPLVALFIRREPGVRFTLSYEVIPFSRTGDRQADIAATTAALQAALEKSIRQNPEQWMWAHRRWG